MGAAVRRMRPRSYGPLVASGAALALLAVGHRAAAHGGHPAAAAAAACEGRALGDACAYEDEAQARYEGTCREPPGGLLCIRNRPIRAVTAVTNPAGARDPWPFALWVAAGSVLVAALIGGVAGRSGRRAKRAE